MTVLPGAGPLAAAFQPPMAKTPLQLQTSKCSLNESMDPLSVAPFSPPTHWPSLSYNYLTVDADHLTRLSRTVYLGNVPSRTTIRELLDHVHVGVVESVRIVADKNCAFISFLDYATAARFYAKASFKKMCIDDHQLKVGWGKPSVVPPSVLLAVVHDNASRNVYLGRIPSHLRSVESLRPTLESFGEIDNIKLFAEKGIGFVHYASISTAMSVVQRLPLEPDWATAKVFYGKDRCAPLARVSASLNSCPDEPGPGSPQSPNARGAAQEDAQPPVSLNGHAGGLHVSTNTNISPRTSCVRRDSDMSLSPSEWSAQASLLAQQTYAAAAVATSTGGASNLGNRTIYIGSLPADCSVVEICNAVRGGLVQNIRYIKEKGICFVTFVEATAAAQFFALSHLKNVVIHTKRVKTGWGRHSGPLPQSIAIAVAAGATRNVYVGNIDSTWTRDRLLRDFDQYGEVEQINFLLDKACAFVNFMNLANAIEALKNIKSNPAYSRLTINFGKDRCANPPRGFEHLKVAEVNDTH